MPQVYDNADFQEGSSRPWDFEKYKPAIVSIALGTNDFSNGDGIRPGLPFDSAVLSVDYIEFVKHVKSKYPEAKIALLSSPMVNGDRRILLQNCLTAVKQHVDNVIQRTFLWRLSFLTQCRHKVVRAIQMWKTMP